VTVTIPDNPRRGRWISPGGDTESVIRKKPPSTTNRRFHSKNRPNPAVQGDSIRSPGKLFERAAETYRYERSIGTDHETANDKAEQRITASVDTNLLLSRRLAQQQTLVRVAEKDERVIGYRRIIHPEAVQGRGVRDVRRRRRPRVQG
jgi:hypothetical protein